MLSLPNSFTRAHQKVLATRWNEWMLSKAGTSWLHKVEAWQVNVLKTFFTAFTNSHAQDHMLIQHASAKTSPKPEVHATHVGLRRTRFTSSQASPLEHHGEQTCFSRWRWNPKHGQGNQSTAAFGLAEVQNLLLLQTGKLALSATTTAQCHGCLANDPSAKLPNLKHWGRMWQPQLVNTGNIYSCTHWSQTSPPLPLSAFPAMSLYVASRRKHPRHHRKWHQHAFASQSPPNPFLQKLQLWPQQILTSWVCPQHGEERQQQGGTCPSVCHPQWPG